MAIQNSDLLPSFVNEIVKIVEDETTVRSNLKSVSDVYSWIEEYGRTSDTKWNLRSSRPSGARLVCWEVAIIISNHYLLQDSRFLLSPPERLSSFEVGRHKKGAHPRVPAKSSALFVSECYRRVAAGAVSTRVTDMNVAEKGSSLHRGDSIVALLVRSFCPFLFRIKYWCRL
ncbi:hypothetical protein AVEN_25854-1 [Araneus ventricosus]|uniref:Uncharacterized protein n=1 Tax=Araneus ventricosus TaxID=182803 RepID=A0A4Y2M9S3_ARAVE|nr:hypothetical protein AVEN_25854-1 [Araneus ventricosus]